MTVTASLNELNFNIQPANSNANCIACRNGVLASVFMTLKF